MTRPSRDFCSGVRTLFLRAIVCFVVVLLAPRTTAAHEGPPFPVVVDNEIGSMLVSVWADPDIGTGTFYVVVEPRGDGMLPDDINVRVGVTPQSGRLEEAIYDAEPQDVRYGARYVTEVAFDQGEWWNVRIWVDSAQASAVITTEVEATPDGTLGPMSLVIFLLPFLAVGFLWIKAYLRRKSSA